MVKNNFLLKAKVKHARLFPVKNAFSYNSTYIIFPLFKIGLIKNFILSINSFNLFSFYDKDHGTRKKNLHMDASPHPIPDFADLKPKGLIRSGQFQNTNLTQMPFKCTVPPEGEGKSKFPTKDWALENLENNGFKKEEISEIFLLTHLRCLGFVFNPVSFYFCLNKENQIIAVIAEVNNTFSETHSYIISEEGKSAIVPNKIYKAEKEFFVSPFLAREGNYEFQFNYSEEKIKIFINYFKEGKLMLTTSLIGKRKNLTPLRLIFSLHTTFKTVLLIVYQALKLVLKKLKFRRPPQKLANNTTFNKYDQ